MVSVLMANIHMKPNPKLNIFYISAKEEETNMMTYLDGDRAVSEGWSEEGPIR